MAFKAKLPLLLFFFGYFLLSFTSTLAYERDPEAQVKQCMSLCKRQQKFLEEQCKQRCVEQYQEQKREQEQRSGEGGNARDVFNINPQREYEKCQQQYKDRELEGTWKQEKRRGQEKPEEPAVDPQKKYEKCQRQCEERRDQQQCQQWCMEILREQKREEQRGRVDNTDPQREYKQCQGRCQQQKTGQQQSQEHCEERRRQQESEQGKYQQQQEEGKNNPYVFDEQSYFETFKTQEGGMSVLPKFTQRSNLHRGIENYRLAILEANPNTFEIPNHCDADAVVYVVKGKTTISMIREQKRDSFNLERGDVIRVPSGSVVYMVNSEQLQIVKLYRSVSTPGHVQEFFSVGAEEPKSFYMTFSSEILEAAFDTIIDRLERLFGQQKKGVIIRASEEQVQALSRGGRSSVSRGPFNILNKRPTYSNNYGQLYEVESDDYKQFQDLDLAVSFVNITKGAMMAPYYNTRATKLILVVEGKGRFEMVCPHLARQSQQQSPRRGEREQEQEEEQEQGGAHYQRVDARLSPRTMFIVPAGHPVTIIASENENLQLVEFTINAQDSQRNFLAGKDNVVKEMEIEAMELGFNVPSKEVQNIYNMQKESVFVSGPKQRQQQKERGGRHGISILDFVM